MPLPRQLSVRARAVPALALTAALTLTLPLLSACGEDDRTDTAVSDSTTTTVDTVTTSTTTTDAAATDTPDPESPEAMSPDATGLDGCAMHMPGELLSAEEAVVRFTPQMVCLGYVTVLPDTPITWINADTADHEVTILDDGGKELNRFGVAAGESTTTPAAATGIYRYKVTAIETFTGTIEVQ